MDENDVAKGAGCVIVFALLVMIPIGAVFHIGWNLIASHATPRLHAKSSRQPARSPEETEQARVDYAQLTLVHLDEFDKINKRLASPGGLIGRVTFNVKGLMGNSDIATLDTLAFDAKVANENPDNRHILYWEMAALFSDAGVYGRQASAEYSIAARRDAHDIIDRHNFRDGWLVTHPDLLGADEAYESTRHPTAASPHTGWTITKIKQPHRPNVASPPR